MTTPNNVVAIKQLAHRLESASSSDRIDALLELQSLAKTSPDIVGEIALLKTFNLLKEQSSTEEYYEALDLTLRLVKCRNKDIAISNTSLVLSDPANVELLLDLLEHEDLTVGVMTSQILTELHGNDGKTLEQQIQQCPDGMIKLLQRLPDSSREEVRNQAIVLIQQLTSSNEEMKKTVVFNEGFEILFKIILDEGGFGDVGIVITDCLKICKNILTDSETCQRLFYAMGKEWIIRLGEFYNPSILEKMNHANKKSAGAAVGDDEFGGNQFDFWFEGNEQLESAVSAVSILYHSLVSNPINRKHQAVILDHASIVINYAAHWIARGGPSDLLNPAFGLLSAVAQQNNRGSQFISQLNIRLIPNQTGKNIPADAESASLEFGWKPLPNDEIKYISFLSLLAERFVYPVKPWASPHYSPILSAVTNDQGTSLGIMLDIPLLQGTAAGGPSSVIIPLTFDRACFLLFEQIISADTTICDLIIQSILAPPPQPIDLMDDDDSQPLELMRPLGLILINSLLDVCEKLFHGGHQFLPTGNNNKNQLELVEKSTQLFTAIYLNGSQLARELTTAITVNHIKNLKDKQRLISHHHDQDVKLLLPYLLASVGKAARLPGGIGYHYIIAILQLLSVIAYDCDRATHQMFEDPSNLFVVDLATAPSELAGVPTSVQAMACLFLGCCFSGFPPEEKAPDSNSGATSTINNNIGENLFHRASFIAMIDNRITMNRFMETLKKPLLPRKSTTGVALPHNPALPTYDHLFLIPGFRVFYEKQVDVIRKIILDLFYGASSSQAISGDSVHQQLIEMQKEKIRELEAKLSEKGISLDSTVAPTLVNAVSPSILLEKDALIQEYQQKLLQLEAKFLEQTLQHQREVEQLQGELKKLSSASINPAQVNELQQSLQLAESKIHTFEKTLQTKEMIEKSLNNDLQDLQSEMESVKRINSEFEMLNLTMKHQLQEKENQIHSSQRSLQSLQNDYLSLQQKVTIYEENNNNLSLKYQQLQKQYDELTQQVQQTVTQPDSAATTVQSLQQKIAYLNQELFAFQEELEKRDDEIITFKERIINAEKATESLEDQLKQNLRKLALYEEELSALKKDASSKHQLTVVQQQDEKTIQDLRASLMSKTTELEKQKIHTQTLSEQYSQLHHLLADYQGRSFNFFEQIVEPLMENVILLNLSDDTNTGYPAENITQVQDDDDIENSAVGTGKKIGREESYVTLSSNDSTYQQHIKTLKHLQQLITQARKSSNTSTPTASPIKPTSGSPPFTPFVAPPSPTKLTNTATAAAPFTPASTIAISIDFQLHYQLYQQLIDILTENNQIIEDVAARCSDYAEGASVKSLQGSEGSLLRILDCCRQLNEKNFQYVSKLDDYEQLKENFEYLQQQYNDVIDKYQLLDETHTKQVEELTELKERLANNTPKEVIIEKEKIVEKVIEVNDRKAIEGKEKEIQELQLRYETTMQQLRTEFEVFQQSSALAKQQLEEKLALLQREHSGDKEHYSQLTKDYAVLEQSLSQTTEQLQKLQQQYGLLQQEQFQAKEQITQKLSSEEEETIQQLRQDLHFQKDQIMKLTTEAENEKRHRNREVQELQKVIEDLQKINRGLNTQIQQLTYEQEDSQYNTEKKEQLIHNEMNEMMETIETLEEEKEDLTKRYKELEKEKFEMIQNHLSHQKKSEEIIKELKHSLKSITQEHGTMAQSLQLKNDELEKKETLDQLLQTKSEELRILSEEQKKISQLLQTKEDALERLTQDKEKESESFQRKIEELQKSLQEKESLSQLLQSKTKDYDKVVQEKDALSQLVQTQLEGFQKVLQEKENTFSLLLEEAERKPKNLITEEQLQVLREAANQSLAKAEQVMKETVAKKESALYQRWNHSYRLILSHVQLVLKEFQKQKKITNRTEEETNRLLKTIRQRESTIESLEIALQTQQASIQRLTTEKEELQSEYQQYKQKHPENPPPPPQQQQHPSYQQLKQKYHQLEQELNKSREIIHSQQKDLQEKQDQLMQREEEMKKFQEGNYLESTLHLQQHEMKRLQTLHNKEYQDLRSKDIEMQELKYLLSSKTGELEGLKITVKSLQEDIIGYQEEITELNLEIRNLRKNAASGGTGGGGSAWLGSMSSSFIDFGGKAAAAGVEEEKERLERILRKIQVQLQNSSFWKNHHFENQRTNGKTNVLSPLTSKLMGATPATASSVTIDNLDLILEQLIKQYDIDRQEKAVALAAVANAKTPTRPSHSDLFSTPSRGEGYVVPLSGISTIPRANGTGGKEIISTVKKDTRWEDEIHHGRHISPKDPSRANPEVLKERQRYYHLHEQHTELLSLLAQQEIEIKTFRMALNERLGELTATTIEEEAQQKVAQLYGAYTNYRKYEDDF